jgi:peptidoglycan/LPS O-acetylase OafA/YrhL
MEQAMQHALGAAQRVSSHLISLCQRTRTTRSSSPADSGVPPAAPGRIDTLDALRGIAALLVVLHHANYMVAAYWGPAMVWLLEWSPLRVLKAGRPAVVFFFVLSGYVLTLALLRQRGPVAPVGWAVRRTVRLLPPVAASVLLSAGLCWWLSAGRPPGDLGLLVAVSWSDPPDLASLLGHMALLDTGDYAFPMNIVLWSLVHEWRVSLLIPAVLLFRGHVALLLGVALLLRSAAISAGAEEDGAVLGRHLHSTAAATTYFLFAFAAGAALALKEPVAAPSGTVRWAAWAAVAAAGVSDTDLAVVGASVLLILLARGETGAFVRLLRSPALQWLGKVSFSLYLVHVPVALALAHALDGDLPAPAIAALTVVLALPAAAVFYKAVERPSLLLSRRAALSTRPSAP